MRLIPFPPEQDLNRVHEEPTDSKIVQEVVDNYRDKSTLHSFLNKEVSLTNEVKGI